MRGCCVSRSSRFFQSLQPPLQWVWLSATRTLFSIYSFAAFITPRVLHLIVLYIYTFNDHFFTLVLYTFQVLFIIGSQKFYNCVIGYPRSSYTVIIGRAGASPPSRTNSMIFLYNI